tara:strand:+ start:117 stop:1337 length:1221 start_codon:yes stop_codon:yes gene_type:complete
MSKNTHLEHLEDSILLDGEEGAKDAFVFIEELCKTFSAGGNNNLKITTKWDGAPAVFCGTFPSTEMFFVGSKSIFNKEAKVNFNDAQVDENHGSSPGLATKLKECLKYLKPLGIKGVAQGDLLFSEGDKKKEKINGQNCLIFQPNTITYCIPEEDELYEKAIKAKLGIVFHTTYTDSDGTVGGLSAKFGYDIKQLNSSNEVLVLSAETEQLGNDILLNKSEASNMQSLRQKSDALVAGSFLDIMAEHNAGKDQLAVGTRLKIFFNKYVREGKKLPNSTAVHKEFKQYFQDECQKAADKLKTPKGKTAKLNKLYEGLDLLKKHEKDLVNTIDLYKNLQLAKEIFIRKLEKGERFGTYLRTENGYKITAPEGYVAIQEGSKAVKLVDRLTFSVANFNVEKNWVSGDGK